MEILALAAVALLLLQPFLAGRLTNPALQAGATIFVSIVIQALPFLVLGAGPGVVGVIEGVAEATRTRGSGGRLCRGGVAWV